MSCSAMTATEGRHVQPSSRIRRSTARQDKAGAGNLIIYRHRTAQAGRQAGRVEGRRGRLLVTVAMWDLPDSFWQKAGGRWKVPPRPAGLPPGSSGPGKASMAWLKMRRCRRRNVKHRRTTLRASSSRAPVTMPHTSHMPHEPRAAALVSYGEAASGRAGVLLTCEGQGERVEAGLLLEAPLERQRHAPGGAVLVGEHCQDDRRRGHVAAACSTSTHSATCGESGRGDVSIGLEGGCRCAAPTSRSAAPTWGRAGDVDLLVREEDPGHHRARRQRVAVLVQNSRGKQ